MLGRLILCSVVSCGIGAGVASAEALLKHKDAEGNVHFGTASDPYLCCMCQPAVDYETHRGQTKFVLPYGLERAVANARVFLSADGDVWYCEGNSIGAIMLALLTEEMGGPAAGESLAERNAGSSWGKIWQELGFIGKEKDAVPPGQLKKEEGKVPPGQLKKTPTP